MGLEAGTERQRREVTLKCHAQGEMVGARRVRAVTPRALLLLLLLAREVGKEGGVEEGRGGTRGVRTLTRPTVGGIIGTKSPTIRSGTNRAGGVCMVRS